MSIFFCKSFSSFSFSIRIPLLWSLSRCWLSSNNVSICFMRRSRLANISSLYQQLYVLEADNKRFVRKNQVQSELIVSSDGLTVDRKSASLEAAPTNRTGAPLRPEELVVMAINGISSSSSAATKRLRSIKCGISFFFYNLPQRSLGYFLCLFLTFLVKVEQLRQTGTWKMDMTYSV